MTSNGKSHVFIGLQYGDEGKGKIIDCEVKKNTAAIARFNGGPNAGHSLEIGGKNLVLHSVPSGVCYKDMILYYGSGCALNPIKTSQEISDVNAFGISVENRFKISGFVPLILPHHLVFDKIYGKMIGSTGNGIGSAYSDQALRAKGEAITNLRFADYLSNPDKYKELVKSSLENIIEEHRSKDESIRKEVSNIDVDKKVDEFHTNAMSMGKYLSLDQLFLENIILAGKDIIFEGAQSVMLDCVTGTVPFNTSSRTIAAAAYTGGDLPVKYHGKVIGVAKAIMSRVGNGPFVSELGGERSENYCGADCGKAHVAQVENKMYSPDKLLKSKDPFDVGIAFRMLTGEYGATTKRPRRMGMLDLVMLKQNCRLNGVDELYINKIDCMQLYSQTNFNGIPLVTGYWLDGKYLIQMPSSVEELRRCTPDITYLPAFSEDISQATNYSQIPQNAKDLVSFIQTYTDTKVAGIGVGPSRDQIIRI